MALILPIGAANGDSSRLFLRGTVLPNLSLSVSYDAQSRARIQVASNTQESLSLVVSQKGRTLHQTKDRDFKINPQNIPDKSAPVLVTVTAL